MTIPPPPIAPAAPLAADYLLAARRTATWRQIVPSHRLPVVAKTPLMIALGVSLSGGAFGAATVGATMLLASALWAVLYILNEATDLLCEHGLHVPRRVLVPLYGLPVVFCVLAGLLSVRLLLPFAGMTASQFIYCAPRFRLKRYWWAIVLLSGTLNPILRLQCGIVWGTHGVSLLCYAAFVFAHLGASLRARVLLRERDRRLGYSTVPNGSETAGKICTALGFVGAIVLCLEGALPMTLLPLFGVAIAFAVYAWSGKETNVARLRRGWLWFALLSLFALAALFAHR